MDQLHEGRVSLRKIVGERVMHGTSMTARAMPHLVEETPRLAGIVANRRSDNARGRRGHSCRAGLFESGGYPSGAGDAESCERSSNPTARSTGGAWPIALSVTMSAPFGAAPLITRDTFTSALPATVGATRRSSGRSEPARKVD